MTHCRLHRSAGELVRREPRRSGSGSACCSRGSPLMYLWNARDHAFFRVQAATRSIAVRRPRAAGRCRRSSREDRAPLDGRRGDRRAPTAGKRARSTATAHAPPSGRAARAFDVPLVIVFGYRPDTDRWRGRRRGARAVRDVGETDGRGSAGDGPCSSRPRGRRARVELVDDRPARRSLRVADEHDALRHRGRRRPDEDRSPGRCSGSVDVQGGAPLDRPGARGASLPGLSSDWLTLRAHGSGDQRGPAVRDRASPSVRCRSSPSS